MEFVNCPLCGVDDGKYLWSKDEAEYFKCKNCSLVYENPRFTMRELQDYYSREQYYLNSGEHTSGYENYFTQCTPELCNEYFNIIEKFSRKKNGKLLDIGSGPGGLLKIAVQKGWEATGLEISRWAVSKGHEDGLDIIETDLLDASFPENHFDVIVMFDVLEHLPHPKEYIKEIHRILVTGGAVIAETPNVAGFYASHLYKENSDIVKPRAHICLYSPTTVKKLFLEGGFTKLNINTFPYCRKFTLGYFKNLIVSRIIPGRTSVQLTWNESLRIVAWK